MERVEAEVLARCVIVDNVPVADEKLADKLKGVVKKIFSGFGSIVEEGFSVPVENGKTLGYAFIEYETAEMAAKAVAEGDNKKLDAKHKLRVTLFNEYERFMTTADEYVAPTRPNIDTKTTDLHSWLLDKEGREQFALRYARDTHVYWSDPVKLVSSDSRVIAYNGDKKIDKKGNVWTEMEVQWSSLGSYLATFHVQGILLWGGPNFEEIGRFSHKGVRVIDISPKEGFLVTSSLETSAKSKGPPSVIFWDLRSGRCARTFDVPVTVAQWPLFRWSHDDKYFCRVRQDAEKKDIITVYETPSMDLVDKKPVEVAGVVDAQWSPAANILAYWAPESDNIPAKLSLIEIPSRATVREVHLFNVSDAKLSWHPQGSFLAARFLKKKAKKVVGTTLAVLRVREKGVPHESLDIPDQVAHFAWDPAGEGFSLVVNRGAKGPAVCFYSCKKNITLVKTVERTNIIAVHWAPYGNACVVTATSGGLIFLETNTFEVTSEVEHFGSNVVAWDPTGRYLTSAITHPIPPPTKERPNYPESSYRVWTSQGALVSNVALEGLNQLLWRPRPPTLLTSQQLGALRQELKDKYWKQFEHEDDDIRHKQLTGAEREKQDMRAQWRAYRQAKEQEYKDEAPIRRDLRGGELSDGEEQVESEQVFEEEFEVVVEEVPAEPDTE